MDECRFEIAQANENVSIVMFINYSKNNFRHSRPICQNAKKERKKEENGIHSWRRHNIIFRLLFFQRGNDEARFIKKLVLML